MNTYHRQLTRVLFLTVKSKILYILCCLATLALTCSSYKYNNYSLEDWPPGKGSKKGDFTTWSHTSFGMVQNKHTFPTKRKSLQKGKGKGSLNGVENTEKLNDSMRDAP